MALAFTPDTKILIDCGVSYCAAKKSLADIGVDIDDVDAVLVTHEHMDHVAGLPKFLEHNKKAVVFVHEKGARALDVRVAPDMQRVIGFGAPFVFKGVSVDFYVCSHDSAFCCGFKITENATGKSIATVTDTGFVNGGFDAFVGGCEAVVLESNYDETMLRSGRYPAALKRRIMSECGHLSNAQACELIVRLAPTSVKTVVLAHLPSWPSQALCRRLRRAISERAGSLKLSWPSNIQKARCWIRMIDKFDKNDGLRIFSFTVFAVLIINLLYSMLLTVFPSLDGEAGFWCVNVILQASLAGVVALYCKSKNISFFSAASLDVKPRVADVFLTMGAGAGTLAFMLPLQNFIVNWFEWMGFEVSVSVPVTGTAGNVVLLIVVACIMPAFCEELVFRGALGNGLAETGLWSASLLGGALFSLFHMNPAQTLHQFVMGFLLVFYILVTGSFWCSFAAHLFNNLLTVVLSLTLGEKIDAWSMDYWYIFILAGAACALPLVWLLYKRRRFVVPEGCDKDAREKNFTLLLLLPALLVCVLFWLSALFAK